MMRQLTYVGFFMLAFLFPAQTGWPVEIYSGGKKFSSVEEYRARQSRENNPQGLTFLSPQSKELKSVKDFLANFLQLMPVTGGIGLNEDKIGKVIDEYIQDSNKLSGSVVNPINFSALVKALGQRDIAPALENPAPLFSN